MKRLKFSVYYRLCERKKFFEKFWEKEKRKFSPEVADLLKMNLYETMEIIVVHILARNIENLKLLLTRTNAKHARIFFDYIMNTEIRLKSKNDVNSTIDRVFNVGDEHDKNIE